MTLTGHSLIAGQPVVGAGQETGLPAARLQGERARTTGQLHLSRRISGDLMAKDSVGKMLNLPGGD